MKDDLIERLEAATGPDRELDAEIAVLADWRFPDWKEGDLTARGIAEKHGVEYLADRMVHSATSMWRQLPEFTASIDSALTLVPAGWTWQITQGVDSAYGTIVHPDCEDGDDPLTVFSADAPTPALAIVIATLRAQP